MGISRLKKVALRELWKHEAHSFTHWMSENLDLLSETLGFQITLVEREAAAGAFSADIRAEDPQGNYVIIENQLEKTDHDHLGKLITYMSNLEAKTAVWITSEPRPEHEAAVHWLNETLPADTSFYLIKIEAYKIDESDPAPLMTVVAGPSLITKQVGSQKKELAERHVVRLEFWKQLIEKLKTTLPVYKNISPTIDNWIGTTTGKSGFGFNFVIRMDNARVELYIDIGDADKNKRIFDNFLANQEQIEKEFGDKLEWQRLDERRACRIYYPIPIGLLQKDQWPEIHIKMIDAMTRLQKALQSEIKKI